MAQQLIEQLIQGLFPQPQGERGQIILQFLKPHRIKRRGAGQHHVPRFRDQLARTLFIQNLKPGRQAGLHRKGLQQALTEGVNGLNLQPARRFQRPCKQLSRPHQRIRLIKAQAAAGDVINRLPQALIVEIDPLGQALEYARFHFRRCRPCIGQAQDALRVHTLQQQADHPPGQDMRLARAGMSGNKGSDLRIGRLQLP